MINELVIENQYESLVLRYEEVKKEVGKSIIEFGKVISNALNELGEKKWKEWLKDDRVGLNITQAYKFIAVSKFSQNNLQLTEYIKSTGIEKAYLLTKIEDPEQRKELAEQIIDVDFNVKETKQVISKINNEHKSTAEAIEEIKKISKAPIVAPEKKTVPIEKHNELKAKYEALLKKNEDLNEEFDNIEELDDSEKYYVIDEQGESLIDDENYQEVKKFFDSQKEIKKGLQLIKEVPCYKKVILEKA